MKIGRAHEWGAFSGLVRGCALERGVFSRLRRLFARCRGGVVGLGRLLVAVRGRHGVLAEVFEVLADEGDELLRLGAGPQRPPQATLCACARLRLPWQRTLSARGLGRETTTGW